MGVIDLILRHRPATSATAGAAARRVGRILGLVAVAVAALAVVLLLSPLVLDDIANSGGADWNRLSDIGAAYGFTSAIVSALALAGVAVSLVVQNRQARAEQVQGIRS